MSRARQATDLPILDGVGWGRCRRAFTLVEILMVLVLLAILAAVVVPVFQPTTASQLELAAHVLASDIQYCQSLALTNNSDYQLGFNFPLNRYEISHQGANTALDQLPSTAFMLNTVGAGGKPTQYNPLGDEPGLQGRVLLHAVRVGEFGAISQFQFDGIGSLNTNNDVTIWLTAGSGKPAAIYFRQH